MMGKTARKTTMRSLVIDRIVEGWIMGLDEGFHWLDGPVYVSFDEYGIELHHRLQWQDVYLRLKPRENPDGLRKMLTHATDEQLLAVFDAQACQRYR